MHSTLWRERLASLSSAADSTGRFVVTAAILTYYAGLATGTAVHWLNDRLTILWRSLWVASQPVMPAPTTEPLPAPMPIPHRPLSLYRVKELRTLARAARLPRSLYTAGRKADLVAALAY